MPIRVWEIRAEALLDIDKTALHDPMIDSPNLPDLGDKQFKLPIRFAVKQKGATCIVLASLHRLHNPIGAVQSLSKVQCEARMGTGERCPFTQNDR